MRTRDTCCEAREIRGAKSPSDEVRKTQLGTRDHDLMRRRDRMRELGKVDVQM